MPVSLCLCIEGSGRSKSPGWVHTQEGRQCFTSQREAEHTPTTDIQEDSRRRKQDYQNVSYISSALYVFDSLAIKQLCFIISFSNGLAGHSVKTYGRVTPNIVLLSEVKAETCLPVFTTGDLAQWLVVFLWRKGAWQANFQSFALAISLLLGHDKVTGVTVVCGNT